MVINRIAPMSLAKISGTLYAFLGLIIGAIFSLIAVGGRFASSDPGGAGMMAAMGVGAIVVFPILYACAGFVGALIGASLYNVVSKMVGGIQVDVQ
jgi:threonine/homoserine efflux transporter RhtA